VDVVHDLQVEVVLGSTSEPQVLTVPASHPAGGAGGPLLVGGAVPHALLFGTQTLT
jgi:hypothetical protein